MPICSPKSPRYVRRRPAAERSDGSFGAQAGAPGTLSADVVVRFEAREDGSEPATLVSYDADAVVGGMLGGVGQRLAPEAVDVRLGRAERGPHHRLRVPRAVVEDLDQAVHVRADRLEAAIERGQGPGNDSNTTS